MFLIIFPIKKVYINQKSKLILLFNTIKAVKIIFIILNGKINLL